MLNLARRPFVNRRPLERLSAFLMILGAALLVLALVLFGRYFSGSTGSRDDLRDVRAQISEERQVIRDLQAELARLDVRGQNSRVEFLNQRIDQRTFAWGRLFEQLGEVLPERVRIESLSPKVHLHDDESRSKGDERGPVTLTMTGVAANTDELLALLDRLFEHEAFQVPRLERERTTKQNELSFSLQTGYLPETDEADPAAAETGVSEPDSATPDASSATPVQSTEVRPESPRGAEAPAGVTPVAGREVAATPTTRPQARPSVPPPSTGRGEGRGPMAPRPTTARPTTTRQASTPARSAPPGTGEPDTATGTPAAVGGTASQPAVNPRPTTRPGGNRSTPASARRPTPSTGPTPADDLAPQEQPTNDLPSDPADPVDPNPPSEEPEPRQPNASSPPGVGP